jgi:serpin B
MQPEPAPKTSHPRRKFFLLGALFELLLIVCCFLPEGWQVVEIHNFTMVIHGPLLMIAEGLGLLGIFILLAGLVMMAWFWGLLISFAAKGVGLLLTRLNPKQKRFARFGAGFAGLACLAWAGLCLLPQTPRPFNSSPEINAVVDANNAFALDLYQKLKDKPGNLFFSPYSISSALAMTCAGARGQTEMEMTNTLHFNLPPEKLHPAFKALMARLDNLQRWNRIKLKCANALWGQKGYPFTADFLKIDRENYSAEAKSVDFEHATGAAVDEINRWIEVKTDGKIPGGFEASQFGPLTRLALCDAIYFKGKWQHPFKKSDTQPAPFYVSTNKTVTVPMMYEHAEFKCATTEYGMLEMLELPYSGRDLSMVILVPGRYVPDDEHFDVHDLELKLTPENLRGWFAELNRRGSHKTSVWLPRFTTANSFNLSDDLKALGMAAAFSDAANFSGMDGTTNLYLSDVFHKTFVEVNEAGTEAAAVSIVLVQTKSSSGRCIVDRPFIFLIRDNGSGSILFLGRIIDPTK